MTRSAPGGRGRMRLAALVLALPVLLTGCGGESRATYSPHAAEQLQADVEKIRNAAEARDVGAARNALGALNRHVAAAQARGDLPRDKARRILQAAEWVAQDVAALPTPSPTSSPSPPHDDGAHEEVGENRNEARKDENEKAKERKEAEKEREQERKEAEKERNEKADGEGEKDNAGERLKEGEH